MLQVKRSMFNPAHPKIFMEQLIYISKFIAMHSSLSRRNAEAAVKEGSVTVNGRAVINPGQKVALTDHVKLNGKLLHQAQAKVYVLINKPEGFITTTKDVSNRPTVIDLLPRNIKATIFPVGRLDFLTSGLILLTNDGDLSYRLAHPKFEVSKTYVATLEQDVKEQDLVTIAKGLHLHDGFIKADRVEFVARNHKRKVLLEIHSGKNRIIRRIFAHLGNNVTSLERVGFAGLSAAGLELGCYRFLTKVEIASLVQQSLVVKNPAAGSKPAKKAPQFRASAR